MSEFMLAVLKGAGILIGALFLLSQLSWWLLGEKYFPSKQLCYFVHWNYRGWFAKEHKFFSNNLAKVTVFGFLATVLLAGIVPLNVSILAQVFSVFFPENEETIILPVIGEYMIFPLLIGLLYALVELALSALRDYRKDLKQSTLGVTLTIGAMIFVEMGLNIYRSVIMAGNTTIARTFWDNLLGIGGPVLAGFLGFVVPLATVLLGAYAMMDFIMPMIQNAAVVIHAALFNTVYAILFLLFGWHPKTVIEIPRQVQRLSDETSDFKTQADELQSQYNQILPLYASITNLAKRGSLPLKEEMEGLERSIRRMEEKLALKQPAHLEHNETTYYPGIASKPELKQAIEETKDEIRTHQTARTTNRSRIKSLSSKVATFDDTQKKLQTEWQRCSAAWNLLAQKLAALEQRLQKLGTVEYCEAINAILRREPIVSSLLSKADCDDLLAQITTGKSAPRQKKEKARAAADLSLKIAADSRTSLVKIARIAEDVRTWLSANPMPAPWDASKLDAQIETTKNQLVDFYNRLNLVAKTTDARFDAMQNNLVTLAWQLAAYLTWVRLHTSLRKSA